MYNVVFPWAFLVAVFGVVVHLALAAQSNSDSHKVNNKAEPANAEAAIETEILNERDIQINRDEDGGGIVKLQVYPNEIVLMVYSDGSDPKAIPYQGIAFGEKTEGITYLVQVVAPDKKAGKTWRVLSGVKEDRKWLLVGGEIFPREMKASGEAFAMSHLIMPLKHKEVELHMFPFRSYKGKLGSVMVLIGKDTEVMKKVLSLRESKQFDWNEKGIKPVESYGVAKD